MDDANKAALIAFAEAQILAGQTLLASLADAPAEPTVPDDEVEETPAPKKRPGRPAKKATPPAKKVAPVKKVDPVEEEPEEDDEDESETEEDPTAKRRTELEAMKILALRSLARKRGFQEPGVKEAGKAELVDAILQDELDSETDEDSEDESVELDRETLEGKGIRELKALAMEKGSTAADLRGLKSDDVIDLILGEGAAEEDEEEGSEEEGEYYTREQYEAMSLGELKAIAREYQQNGYPDFTFPANIKKPALIDLLMEGEEEEDEDEE